MFKFRTFSFILILTGLSLCIDAQVTDSSGLMIATGTVYDASTGLPLKELMFPFLALELQLPIAAVHSDFDVLNMILPSRLQERLSGSGITTER